jgi:hypothetical protein
MTHKKRATSKQKSLLAFFLFSLHCTTARTRSRSLKK